MAKPAPAPAAAPAPVRVTVREGESIDVAGVTIRVMHVGHHSEGDKPQRHAIELAITAAK